MQRNNDAGQIRELTDALHDLEQALSSSGISRNLETIAGSLSGLVSNVPSSIRELDFLYRSFMAFATIGSAIAAIDGVERVLGNLKITLSTGKIGLALGAIALVVGTLGSLFRGATGPANDFAEALANGTSGLDTQLDKLKRLQDLYWEHTGLTAELKVAHAEWRAALGTDEAVEAFERYFDLRTELYNLNGEMTALEGVVGRFSEEQIEAAIQTAIMEGAIEDAAEAVSSLKAAYQAAYDAALASINSQLGLFDRMNFEASKAVTEMATTWGYQAEDIQKHNENLRFAIESDLLPGVVSSFADINEAGHLNEVIESIRDAGYEMIVTVSPTLAISAIRQMKTGRAA
ncbi:MAG: hypothetical protein FWD84_03075 [Oscillospiraceae bacterium]|nr:hypothetical protein [Oscillospiraceae bacterium]